MTRRLITLTGEAAPGFLDNLITNTVPAPGTGLRYAALLTPQGKFVADFFVLAEAPDRLLIDVAASHAPTLAQRLTMYRLRAAVEIAEDPRTVYAGTGPVPEGAHADPRDPALGWRAYGTGTSDGTDWTALRVAHVIPETGLELTPDSYILEMDFERLHGVDFRKGCFVGQEIVARMKHKTELRKGLARVRVTGPAEPGTGITDAEGRAAGTLHTRAGDRALAYLRFDRATGPLQAGAATVTRDDSAPSSD